MAISPRVQWRRRQTSTAPAWTLFYSMNHRVRQVPLELLMMIWNPAASRHRPCHISLKQITNKPRHHFQTSTSVTATSFYWTCTHRQHSEVYRTPHCKLRQIRFLNTAPPACRPKQWQTLILGHLISIQYLCRPTLSWSVILSTN